MRRIQLHPLSVAVGVLGVGMLAMAQQGTPTNFRRIHTLTDEQAEILEHLSIVYLDDGAGNLTNKTIRITGVTSRS